FWNTAPASRPTLTMFSKSPPSSSPSAKGKPPPLKTWLKLSDPKPPSTTSLWRF
ncbi:MAG: hypothetical protein L6R42_011487, partial [Xanthoria sp. 1 TBL-2021]